ncbi:SagB family peptide dehydrogenase [Nocardia terpenica]|uniref:SagB family peptide dehydrogenase n=1 Tax=Nocardia terpenica TaxID=455432 RepID=UPI001893E346|nr:SagB family peptide dehydrogenase [Nocardia terpenica]MBF6066077.1 SagB family peptide dehydrogenase [Nocardia terpenica]MBF6109232.1 SagB family peptide dehydrogenase [Nocardia terpenica]MBF6116321.1 SagB family peptide dehydrogenase [Nocardia terpenica]MBF6123478.1 SagB family peptide dehydrogenase [Nocardia terpenica]MBF6156755.1 SagB family peptide dehydrogenase [Nocardia terpenica]
MIAVAGTSGRRHRLTASAWQVLSAADAPATVDKLAEASGVSADVVLSLVAAELLIEPQRLSAGSWWDPHELVIQRMRGAGHKRAMLHRQDMPAPRKPLRGEIVALPDTDTDPRADPGFFTQVLSQRRSCRRFADRPLDLSTLATFLRTSSEVQHSAEDYGSGVTWRPVPSGGGRHPLEIYLWPVRMTDLAPAIYRFDPFESVLCRHSDLDQWFSRMPEQLRAQSELLEGDPAVMLLVTAVFGRTMWKYENNGLSIVYQDLGALYQTWYLVATALGLGGCVLNGGNELVNARVLGLDPVIEGHVGGFLLGWPRDERYRDPLAEILGARE